MGTITPEPHPPMQAIFCILLTHDSLKRFLLWTVAGHMAVGTRCWIATTTSLAVVCTRALTNTLRSSGHWRRDISIHVRFLLDELAALIPACIMV